MHTYTHTYAHRKERSSKDYCIGVPRKRWMPNMMQRNTQIKVNRKESSTKLSAISLVYCKRLFGNLLLYNTLV